MRFQHYLYLEISVHNSMAIDNMDSLVLGGLESRTVDFRNNTPKNEQSDVKAMS